MSIISKMFADKWQQSECLDKYVTFAEPGLKGLMDIFVQNYLTPYLESINEPRMQTELKFDESD